MMYLVLFVLIAPLAAFSPTGGGGDGTLTRNRPIKWPSSSTRAAAAMPWLATSLCSSSSTGASADTTVADATSSKTLTLFSPCKINLFLRILGKRPDGFHDLASLFQAVGFGDTLELTTLADDATTDQFDCNMPGVPVDSSNLVLRALELMRTKTQRSTYFGANLIKQVPAQAGLGGGSANAATAMWGANQLLGKPASLEQLIEWSAELGSDITFFLSRGTAYCTGRGEIMTALDPPLPAGTPVCIVKPSVGLSTPSVFQALDYDELSELDADHTLMPAFKNEKTSVANVASEYFVNDLEPPAFRCVPALAALKRELQQVPGLTRVMMSGSGTSIFCLGEPQNGRAALQAQLGARTGEDAVQVFFTQFINRASNDEWFHRPAA